MALFDPKSRYVLFARIIQTVDRRGRTVQALSAAATKALVYRGLEEPDRTRHHDLESDVFRWTGQQADAREGIAAFLQKRAPNWPLAKTRDFPPQLAATDPATLR